MEQTIKYKKIHLFVIVLFTCIQVSSQNTVYKLHFKHVELHSFCLPPIPDETIMCENINQCKNILKNYYNTAQVNVLIDSCVISGNILNVYFNQENMQVLVHTKHREFYECEMEGLSNFKHTFILKIPMCCNMSFEGNIIMLQSFGNQYFFKKKKKNRFQYVDYKSMVDMEYIRKYKLKYNIID